MQVLQNSTRPSNTVPTKQVAPLVKATSPSLGGAGIHVTTTLTELQELPAEEPPEPVKPVISLTADPEQSELEVSTLYVNCTFYT